MHEPESLVCRINYIHGKYAWLLPVNSIILLPMTKAFSVYNYYVCVIHRDLMVLLETLDLRALLVLLDLRDPRDAGDPRERLVKLETSEPLESLVFQ